MKTKSILGFIFLVVVSLALANCANQGKPANLDNIHFDLDKSYIRSDMIPVMDGNVRYLKGSERHFSTKSKRSGWGAHVTIEGNCDERGSVEYNYALGARRAESAKSYLVTHGIDVSRLKTVSFGEDRPKCKDHNEACWYKNRRDDLKMH